MSERSPARRSVTVEIAGERHVLRSDASPEHTESVAAHVDSTIRALSLGNVLEPHRVAILAALTVTNDFFRERDQRRTLEADLSRVRDELARAREEHQEAMLELQALREEIVRRSSRLAYLLERAAEAADPEDEGPTPAPARAVKASTPSSKR